jgi:hypothetical protein
MALPTRVGATANGVQKNQHCQQKTLDSSGFKAMDLY